MTDLPYDLILDPTPETDDGDQHLNLGLTFERDPRKGAARRIDPDPGRETTDNPVYNRFVLGMGYTEDYRPGGYGWAEGAYTRGGTFVMPAGRLTELNLGTLTSIDNFPIRSSVEVGGYLSFFGGRNIIRVNVTGTPLPFQAEDLGANVATGNDAAVVFQDRICLGSVNATTDATYKMHTSADGGLTWVRHDGTGGTSDIDARAFTSVYWDGTGVQGESGIGDLRLLRMPTRHSFRTAAADPTVGGNWSAEVDIGDTTYPVNSIVTTKHHVYFAKLEGIIDVNARGYSANLTPYWRQGYSLANGVAALVHEQYLYGGWSQGLDRVTLNGMEQDTPQSCGPGADLPNGSPIAGYISAMCTEKGWLCAAVYNPVTTNSYICYGKDREILRLDVPGLMVWHGAEYVIPGIVSHMRVSDPADGKQNLWIWTHGTGAGYPRCFVADIPAYGSNPLQDLRQRGAHEYQDTFSIYFPDGWNAPTSRRTLYRTDVHSERLGGPQLSVYANRNKEVDSSGDTVWELEAVATSSPRTTEISTNAKGPNAYTVDFKVVGTGEFTDPPILRALAPQADVNREQMKIYTFRAFVARGQSHHHGTDMLQNPESVRGDLWRLISENATPVSAIDRHGNEMVLQIMPEGFHIDDTEERTDEYAAVITFSARVLYGIYYWDSGIAYDTEPVYT